MNKNTVLRKKSEHTANLALAQAPIMQGWKVGANFFKVSTVKYTRKK